MQCVISVNCNGDNQIETYNRQCKAGLDQHKMLLPNSDCDTFRNNQAASPMKVQVYACCQAGASGPFSGGAVCGDAPQPWMSVEEHGARSQGAQFMAAVRRLIAV